MGDGRLWKAGVEERLGRRETRQNGETGNEKRGTQKSETEKAMMLVCGIHMRGRDARRGGRLRLVAGHDLGCDGTGAADSG